MLHELIRKRHLSFRDRRRLDPQFLHRAHFGLEMQLVHRPAGE
jgi:hypothetical protein